MPPIVKPYYRSPFGLLETTHVGLDTFYSIKHISRISGVPSGQILQKSKPGQLLDIGTETAPIIFVRQDLVLELYDSVPAGLAFVRWLVNGMEQSDEFYEGQTNEEILAEIFSPGSVCDEPMFVPPKPPALDGRHSSSEQGNRAAKRRAKRRAKKQRKAKKSALNHRSASSLPAIKANQAQTNPKPSIATCPYGKILSQMPPLSHWPERKQKFSFRKSYVAQFIRDKTGENWKRTKEIFDHASWGGVIVYDKGTQRWRGHLLSENRTKFLISLGSMHSKRRPR